MSKLIIWVGGRPSLNGHKRREFIWNATHAVYVYGGLELSDTEFNDAWAKAYRNNADLHPQVKVVGVGAAPAAVVPIEPIATISVAREVTLEEALAVVARLEPERLKKKTGPRGVPMLEVG